jgi:formylglycine-generating enzyme required for sulfatase activity
MSQRAKSINRLEDTMKNSSIFIISLLVICVLLLCFACDTAEKKEIKKSDESKSKKGQVEGQETKNKTPETQNNALPDPSLKNLSDDERKIAVEVFNKLPKGEWTIEAREVEVCVPEQIVVKRWIAFYKNKMGTEFIWIKPGTFTMGSETTEPGRNRDETQHQVKLTKGFFMQITEVSQAQWKALMGEDNNPSNFKGDDLPVESVSWDMAQDFIKKLNEKDPKSRYRLPTEAEWEYACRAGTQTAYYWGSEMNDKYCWYSGKSDDKTHPVGTKNPNKWGLYNMSGNVYEWCEDKFGDYPAGSVTDPPGVSDGDHRALRGGSWYSSASLCRSADRDGSFPSIAHKSFGFRLMRTSE